MKKILSIALLGLLLFSGLAIAQGNQTKFSGDGEQIRRMEQSQNRFQERYNFTCEGVCNHEDINGKDSRLEVRNQKRFLFWNVESLETYNINEEGEIIQARYNIWSRLLNRNKVRA